MHTGIFIRDDLENDIEDWLQNARWQFHFEDYFIRLYVSDNNMRDENAGTFFPVEKLFVWSGESPFYQEKYAGLYTTVKMEVLAKVFLKKFGIELNNTFF